jgi:hypothetical protein
MMCFANLVFFHNFSKRRIYFRDKRIEKEHWGEKYENKMLFLHTKNNKIQMTNDSSKIHTDS